MSLYVGTSDQFKVDFIAGITLFRPLIESIVAQYLKPMIGEIKFSSKADRAIPGLNLSENGYYTADQTFDGWVWADGISRYSAADFPSANSIFNSSSSSSFVILKISDFICGANEGGKIVEEAHVDLPSHDHQAFVGGTIGTGNTIEIPSGFAYISTSKASKQNVVPETVNGISGVNLPAFHYGIQKNNEACVPLPVDMSLKMNDYLKLFNNASTDYVGEDDPKFNPEAQQLQAMIYIGKKGE